MLLCVSCRGMNFGQHQFLAYCCTFICEIDVEIDSGKTKRWVWECVCVCSGLCDARYPLLDQIQSVEEAAGGFCPN